jgi:hypothetical protein
MQMEIQYDEWIKEYYTEEQLAQLKTRPFTVEDQARVEAEWNSIFAEAKRLAEAGADPAGKEAQVLAVRYQAMIGAFTGGDPGIEASLNRMYADKEKMPEEMRQRFEGPTGQFTSAMMAAYREKSGR